jgi:hypothetical protein
METTPSPLVLVKNELTWLQKHERIILVALVLLVGCWLGNKWLNNRITNAEQKVTVAEQRLEDQKVVNDKLAQQSAAQASQYQTLVEMLTRQNAALTAAISSRDASLKQKQEQIKTEPLPQVALDWQKLLGLPSDALTIQGTSVVVPDPIARSTVSQLAKTATLEQDLTDQKAITANVQSEVVKANGVISAQAAQITGLNTQIVDSDKAHKAELAKVKAVGRKAKIKWFLTGFLSGLLARSAIQGL